MDTIEPKNITAQLNYRAMGNPPSTMLSGTVSNCYPGLEFDLRNLWKRVFVGIELHEVSNLVLGATEDHPELNHLRNALLREVSVDGTSIALGQPPSGMRAVTAFERSNALVDMVRRFGGRRAQCRFVPRPVWVDASSTWPGFSPLLAADVRITTVGRTRLWTSWRSEPTGAPRAEQLIFDFGVPRTIERIIMRPALDDFNANFPNAFRWELGSDGASWTTVFETVDFGGPPDPFGRQITIVPLQARFARLRINETLAIAAPGPPTFFAVALGDVVFDIPPVAEALEIRPLLPAGETAPLEIAEIVAPPGALTQSLCSPWQNDYRDCACFYWAASRPDIVNVQPGTANGHNWMDSTRAMSAAMGTPDYGPDDITHEILFARWEDPAVLRFIVGGEDSE